MSFSLGEYVDISQVLSLKDQFLSSIKEDASFSIDGSSVARIDGAGLQLLLCAKHACEKHSVSWQWKGASSELVNAASALGLVEELQLEQFVDG